jgi:hypothetical protein
MMMSISSGRKEMDMNTSNAPSSGIAADLLIPLVLTWIDLVIRWGMLRIAGLVAISAWILLSEQIKIANKERS